MRAVSQMQRMKEDSGEMRGFLLLIIIAIGILISIPAHGVVEKNGEIISHPRELSALTPHDRILITSNEEFTTQASN